MVDRAFLRPRSVAEPPQGDFRYLPEVRIYTDTTAAGLQAQLDIEFDVSAASVQELWVIESIQYAVVVTQPGPNPDMEYSALVWATKVERV
jgi:hypothetical protein